MAMNEVNKITVAPAVGASEASSAAAQANEAKEVMNSAFTEAGAQPVKEEVTGEIKMGGADSPEALAIKAREDAVKAHQEADTARAKVQRELDENNKLVGGKEYVAQLEKELEAIKQQEKEAKQKKAEIEKDIATKQRNKQRLEASVLEGKSKADAAIIKHGDDIKAKKEEIAEAKKHVRELEKDAKQADKAAKAADKNYQELFNAAKKQIQGEKKEKISDLRHDAKVNKTIVKQSEGDAEGENKNVARDVSAAQYQKQQLESLQQEIDDLKAGLADKEKEPLKGLEEAKQELEKTQNAVGEKERIYTEKQAEFKKLKSLTPEQTQEQMQLLEEYNSALDEQEKAEREVKIKQELYDAEQKKIERKEQELANQQHEWEQAVSAGKTTIKTEKKSDIETAKDEAQQRIDILKGNDPKPAKKAEVKPEAAKPEAPKAEVKPEAAKPEAPKAEVKPEVARPEAPKAEVKPEVARPEAPKAEVKPEAARPEAPKAEVKPEAAKPVASQERTQDQKQVTVLNGEGFAKLAQKYGVSVDDIIELNQDKIHKYTDCNGKVHKFFRVGEAITLPDGASAEAVKYNQENANAHMERNKYRKAATSERNINKLAGENCDTKIKAQGPEVNKAVQAVKDLEAKLNSKVLNFETREALKAEYKKLTGKDFVE